MSSVKGLGHVGIIVKDMGDSIHFYQNILGFKLDKEDVLPGPEGDTKLSILSAGTCIIELIEKPAQMTNVDNIGPLIEHLCLEVTNIEQIKKELDSLGIQFETDEVSVMPELLGGIKNIFFKGLNGERLELVEII